MAQFAHKRLFLTGGTGVFGKSLLEYLYFNEPECEVWTLSRRGADGLRNAPLGFPANVPNFRHLVGDARNFEFPPERFDYVVHAATLPASAPDIEEFSKQAALHAVEFARQNNAKVLFLSSGAVYRPSDVPQGETSPLEPPTAYGRGKMSAEKVFAASGLPVAIERAFSFCGKYTAMGGRFAFADFARAALARRPIVVIGNRHTVRGYLDEAEWAKWSLILLARATGIYNVGSPRATTVGELAALFGTPEFRETGRADFYLPNLAKITADFGLQPQITLEESVRNTLEFYAKSMASHTF